MITLVVEEVLEDIDIAVEEVTNDIDIEVENVVNAGGGGGAIFIEA